MLDFITKSIAKVFGTKSDRDVKELEPYVGKVNAVYPQLATLSDDELRGKSRALKATIRESLAEFENQIQDLTLKTAPEAKISPAEKERLFSSLDKLYLDRNKRLEEVLLEILPEAFAVIKETARRYTQNGGLTVTATDHDRARAQRRPHIQIQGDKAFWPKEWTAAGAPITWEMVHYDVQIIGGVVLHQGKISEMATGEGKTLVATFPAFLNALAGYGVHIVTVNDYLAKRDSEWMAPLFEFHELVVDCIDAHEPNTEARRQAYLADITYGTNNEFGFDYLRDNMARDPEELVQRKLHYAMVDEVDSVLIDDARTPLIISGPMAMGDQQDYEVLKPRVSKVYEAQKAIVTKFLIEAKKLIAEGNEKEGGLALFRAYRGLPKNKATIKFLSETGNKAIMQKIENYYLADNSKLMPEADKPLLFTIDEKNNQVDLTQSGIAFITSDNEDPQFFILPDLSTKLSAIDKNKDIDEDEKLRLKDLLTSEYALKSKRIHTVQQLLKAYALFEKEQEYVVMEGKVKIVDEQTGRILEGRRYSDGLHQAIEAKEGVKVEDATQTYATVTLQNYFRMYHKLAGMTGTAETEAGEFWQIYKLDVVVIPTNKNIVRTDAQDKVYKTVREKFNAVAEEIVTLTQQGRPVLVGTTSVEISELLSRMLKQRGIQHQVLNAKYHQREAEIVSVAGRPGTVTIATNMAGRGTDIKLTPESRAAGGLAIIGTERHESRRVDRQLRGRSGRQGDPGSSQFFVSLEDNLMRLFGSDRIVGLMDKMGLQEGEVIQHSMITRSIERAQKKVEENHFGTRKRLLEYDDVMNAQREVIYKRRRNALFGDRLELDLMDMVYKTCEQIVNNAKQGRDFEQLQLQAVHVFGMAPHKLTADAFEKGKASELVRPLFDEVWAYYRERITGFNASALPVFMQMREQFGAQLENVVVPLTDGRRGFQVVVPVQKAVETEGAELMRTIEKMVTLGIIDQLWKEHLREMDELKQATNNAYIEQKDPLLIYKMEALQLFKQLVAKINEDVLSFLFKVMIVQEQAADMPPAVVEPPQYDQSDLRTARSEEEAFAADEAPEQVAVKREPIRVERAINRNDRVSVRYHNGELKKDVKFKTVEEDVANGLCVVVEVAEA